MIPGPGARNIARKVHQIIGKSPSAARLYLCTVGWLAKRFPDNIWKQRIKNALEWSTWPEISLPPRTVELTEGISVNLIPHIGEFDFTALLFRKLPYEPEVFHWLATRHYDTIFEIGANVGVFTLFLARRFPKARIYAFEPSPAAHRRLIANFAANNEDRPSVFTCAVSDSTAFADFFEPAGHLTNGSLDPAFAAQFSDQVVNRRILTVDAQTLAPLISGRTLIKLDIEGAEPRVLRAMMPLLCEHRPDLLIEVLENTAAELNTLEFLFDGQYSIVSLTRSGPIPVTRFEAGEFRDFALYTRPQPPLPLT